MAVGKAGEPADRDKLSIWFNGIRVAHKGARDPAYDEGVVSQAMKNDTIALKVSLGLGRGADRVLTCDLTRNTSPSTATTDREKFRLSFSLTGPAMSRRRHFVLKSS